MQNMSLKVGTFNYVCYARQRRCTLRQTTKAQFARTKLAMSAANIEQLVVLNLFQDLVEKEESNLGRDDH
jgi:hypothetical protein